MSRKKNKGKGQQRTVPAQTGPNPQPAQHAQSAVDRQQDRRIRRAEVISIAGFAISLLMAYFAYDSAKSGRESADAAKRSADEAGKANALTQAANDRAAGKIQAHFEFVDEPQPSPEELKPFIKLSEGYKQPVFRLDDVSDLIRWEPHVQIRNIGTEIIDGLKIEVIHTKGRAYGYNVKQIEPRPTVSNRITTTEMSGFGKIMPGQTATILIGPALMGQMAHSNFEPYAEKDYEGFFGVRVLAKIVGASNYDQMKPIDAKFFNFHWKAKGFHKDDQKFTDYLNATPVVVIK